MIDLTPDDEFTRDIHHAYANTPRPRPDALNAVIAAAVAETCAMATAIRSADDLATRRPQRSRPWVRAVAIALPLVAAWAIVVLWKHEPDVKSQQRATIASGSMLIAPPTSLPDKNPSMIAPLSNLYKDTIKPLEANTYQSPSSRTLQQSQTPATANANPTPLPSANPTISPRLLSSPTPRPNDNVTDGLDPETAALVAQILDSAAISGLPMTPLIARVHEGIRRGVPGPRIVVVTRNYATALTDARAALGFTATLPELQSGAEALLAGAPVSAIQQFRAARPTGSLTEPLVALADLTAHGVAPRQAATALASILAHGGSDTPIRVLRADVIGDIVRGVSPGVALAGRLRQTDNESPQSIRPPLNTTPDSTPLRRGSP